MSIFVDTLSFQDAAAAEQVQNAGKIAILVGSLAAGALGSFLITLFSKSARSAE